MPAPKPGRRDAGTTSTTQLDEQVAGLDGGVPVTLFPVRLETRFAADRSSLRIRIFPEQVHIDSHEPALTDSEIAAGRVYWRARWAATSTEDAADAWLTLARQTDPPRARWIAETLTPTNVGQIGDPAVQPHFPTPPRRFVSWSRTPVARLLPSQWVAIGFRGADEVFRVVGRPVREELAAGLSPEGGDPDANAGPTDTLAGVLGDDEFRWLVDYAAAVDAGMAITVDAGDLTAGDFAEGLDRLIVVGVDWSRDPAQSAAEIAAQLDRHAVTDGLALLGPGTPTNNTETERAATNTDPLLDPAAYDPATPPAHTAGARVAAALAAQDAAGLLDAPGSHGLDDQVDADLAGILWPGLIGYLCSLMFHQESNFPAVLTPARHHAERFLRPSGPYPALRVGDQPYGVLPVLSHPVRSGGGFLSQLSSVLDQLRRRTWSTTVPPDPVPRLDRSENPDIDLVDLLRRTPVSQILRYRPLFSGPLQSIDEAVQLREPAVKSYAYGDPYHLGDFVTQLDPQGHPMVAALLQSAPLPVPLVSLDPLSESEPLGPSSYLGVLEQTIRQGQDGVDTLADPVAEPRPLLDLLVRQAVTVEAGNDGDLERYASRLRNLADVPTAELNRRVMGALDAATHRLDAWITSVATAQLDAIRQSEPGSYIGGFGYVENLRPSERPASEGFVHCPSVAHAATAAILRSGHLSRCADGDDLLAIDLRSGRVELGLEMLAGVGAGVPTGALLGYRFERGLRDHDITLTRYVLSFRRTAPLPSSSAGPIDDGPIEAVAARDVVDGLALLERWSTDRDGLFDEAGVEAVDRPAIDVVLARLADAVDAVSDLLVAESVHQTVTGNPERAAAALDALDRQESIPELDFVRTPRTGAGHEFRVGILAGPVEPAAGWEGLDDPRRRAEPRLDRWTGAVLGPPHRYLLAADVIGADGETSETVTATLADLGLSAISVITACANSGAGGSELEARLALQLGSQVESAKAERLVLSSQPPAGANGGALGLGDLLALASEVRDLLAAGRPADNLDLILDPLSDHDTAARDVTELRARADGAVAALAAARDGLAGLDDATDAGTVVAALLAAADAGVGVAVQGPPDVSRAMGTAERMLAAIAVLDDGFVRSGASEDDAVNHDLARIRAVFGASFPVVPAFGDDPADLVSSMGDESLLGGDPLAPATWLTVHARVRPAVTRLVNVIEAAEMLGGEVGLDQVTVAQLPWQDRPDQAGVSNRWIGLESDGSGVPPAGRMSIVVHLAPGTEWFRPMGGLIIDRWSDTVPATEETTGLSFHFDAPGARAPQSILLAVPAARNTEAWSVDDLAEAVREAMDLARTRAFDLDDLKTAKGVLPAIWLFAGPDLDLRLPELVAAVTSSDDTEEPS